MIDYGFVPASMDGLDTLEAEVIVLPFFSDERPLVGAAGFADWRLCGALSRKLMASYLDGHFGEKGWIASPGKLNARSILLFGLGPRDSFDGERAESACTLIADALDRAKVTTAAIALPGRSLDLLPPLEALRIWLDAQPTDGKLEEVTIIERAEEHRSLIALFDGLRRQSESPLA